MNRDVFICHAGEDKQEVVIPLAEALENEGVTSWVDKGEIKWGDSITQKVNKGLKISRFVIVVLSGSFIGKHWPEREMYAALNIEASSGEVKVLPLVVGDTNIKAGILNAYPLLNDKKYLNWEGKPGPIVNAALELLSGSRPSSTTNEKSELSAKSTVNIPLPKLRKPFSDRDRDVFLIDSFDVIKNYFQRALIQLDSQYTEIDSDFTEVHRYNFIAKVYLRGETKCQSKIWIGGLSTSDGIAYSESRINMGHDNSFNELITIEDDGYKLYLSFSMGIMYQKNAKNLYDPQDAAELLWSRFVAPLERQ